MAAMVSRRLRSEPRMPRREGIQLKLRNAHYWKATKNQTPTLLWFLCLLTYFWILSYFILFLCMCSPFLLFFLHFPKHWVDMGRPSRYQPTARHFDLDRAPQATGADATWRDAGCGCQTSAPQRICRLATEILKMYENVEDLFLENLTEAYGWWFVAFLSIGCIYWIGLNCWASWQIWDSQPGKNRLQKKNSPLCGTGRSQVGSLPASFLHWWRCRASLRSCHKQKRRRSWMRL